MPSKPLGVRLKPAPALTAGEMHELADAILQHNALSEA